jgi:hypothetical protein
LTERGITVGKSWPRPTTDCDLVPKWEGEFKDHDDWINFATTRLGVAADSNGHELKAICVDTLGRRCANGRDFARARDEGTFPVRYFWDCQPSSRARISNPGYTVIEGTGKGHRRHVPPPKKERRNG